MTGIMQVALPLLGGAGMLSMLMANRNPLMVMAGAGMLVAMVAGGVFMFVNQRTGASKRLRDQRRRYLDHIDDVRGRIRDATTEQRELARRVHPAPAELPDLVRNPERVWERRPHDPDFLVARIGLGKGTLWRPIKVGGSPGALAEPDPITNAAVELTMQQANSINELPVAVPLRGVVSVVGPPEHTRNTLRAMVAQLVALHAPEDVRLAWCIGRSARPEFEWAKWLPHTLDTDAFDGPAPRRLVATDPRQLSQLLHEDVNRRVAEASKAHRFGGRRHQFQGTRLVVVADQVSAGAVDLLAGRATSLSLDEIGVSTVVLVQDRRQEPSHVDYRITCDGAEVTVEALAEPDPDQQPYELRDRMAAERRYRGASSGVPDTVDLTTMDALAREVSPLRLVEEKANVAPLENTVDLRGMLGVNDEATYDIDTLWKPRPLEEFLNIPFGVGPSGRPVYLDFKEPALGGMGPHGLCIGATGSGKSEVLRSLVLSLAMTHPPERLSLVLVDYKGGATFAGLEKLPHTSAMISNLSDDHGLVDRLHDAIFGEMKRRQQILLDAGNLPNITVYNERRDAGEPLEPLPNLMVVIDEFSELLTAKPDFIELFLAIGRIGRSIGVHLLLASQRLEEGRMRGLESFLSYRIGLRTFNEQESRVVLGVPDAYTLPPVPGNGYLKVDTTLFERFRAVYVSGPYEPPRRDEAAVDAPPTPAPFPLFNETQQWLDQAQPARAPQQQDTVRNAGKPVETSTLDVVVDRLAARGRTVRQIWLPPLPRAVPLSAVTGPLGTDAAYGLTVADARARGTLTIPLGILDIPAEQRQETLTVDLASGGGHLAVMGAPQTGKSTVLRTMICAASLTHTPSDLAFYCVDLGGGTLASLERLPHVGGVAGRLTPDRVRRTVSEVATLLAEREELFSAKGIDSVETLRAMHRAGRVPELTTADICLVIDGYLALRNDFEDLIDVVHDIGARGAGFGVHLVVTVGRWSDLRMQAQAVIGNKIELRLNDPMDSSIRRQLSQNLRADSPGRCIVSRELMGHVALPRIDGSSDAATVSDGVEHLVGEIVRNWSGPVAAPIRMLPTRLLYPKFAAQARDERKLRIGVDEAELRPVTVDLFGADQHLMVIGDSQSGRTSFLRLVVQDLITRYSSDEVVFGVIDIRRTLMEVVPEDYLGGYAPTSQIVAGMSQGIANMLAERLPPEDVTVQQLKERSWWKGPEIVMLVDDYDLLSTGGPGPLAPFAEYLAQSRDIGFHMIVARRAGGAGRAMHEPFVQRLREAGSAGLLLSGDRQEGQLWPGAFLSQQPPGRGLLVRKGRKPILVQTAYVPQDEDGPTTPPSGFAAPVQPS